MKQGDKVRIEKNNGIKLIFKDQSTPYCEIVENEIVYKGRIIQYSSNGKYIVEIDGEVKNES